MDRVSLLKRPEILRELQTHNRYTNKTQKEISEKLGPIENLRNELRRLEQKSHKEAISYFEHLPLELVTHITEQYDVKNARLINKQTLKANDIKFCNEIKTTQEDIDHYIINANHRFAIKLPMKALIYNQHRKLLFTIFHMKNVDVMQGRMNPIHETLIPFNKEIDLYSYYHMYRSKGCDQVIKHYAKNRVIGMLNANKFINLKRYVYLVTNAVVMGLIKNPESIKADNKSYIKQINEILYDDILTFLNQLD